MFDLALTAFVALMMLMGGRRPFIWVLTYLYVDIISPQKMSWRFLQAVPLSLIAFVLAVMGWVLLDNKKNSPFTLRQGLILALLVYCGLTTLSADFPTEALDKWSWVWKSLLFGMFLPVTLRTRLRIESAALIMVLSAGAILLGGALKTLASGGGYGMLHLFVADNTGLYEGSTLACVAVAIIPLALWLANHGTIFPPSGKVRLAALGLTGAALLIPVGTEARTGLVCAAVLAVLVLRTMRHRLLYLVAAPVVLVLAWPVLPASFTKRMDLIQNNEADESASTRVAVWKWTIDYAMDHPMGGGFDSFRGNHITVSTRSAKFGPDGRLQSVVVDETSDKARAFHSAYFELLGEQGWPGLLLWMVLQIMGIIQLEAVQHRLRNSKDPRDKSDRALAGALQQGQIVYMVGANVVGIAYQPFIYMLIGLQIALVEQVRRRHRVGAGAADRAITLPNGPQPAPAGAA